MIKPNIDEICDIIGHRPENIKEIIFHAQKLIKSGIKVVAVTLGSDGSLIVSENEAFRIYPPKSRQLILWDVEMYSSEVLYLSCIIKVR